MLRFLIEYEPEKLVNPIRGLAYSNWRVVPVVEGQSDVGVVKAENGYLSIMHGNEKIGTIHSETHLNDEGDGFSAVDVLHVVMFNNSR